MIDAEIEWLTMVANRLHKRLPRRVERNELLSDGYIALVKLRQQYDARRGVPFRCFALKRIVGSMIDGLRRRNKPQRPQTRRESEVDRSVDARLDLRLDRLSRRCRLVIQLHYREQLELRAVAQIFRCSQGRVSQIHQLALAELREA